MNDISIKESIINNFKDDDEDAIRKSIDESVEEDDEMTLPGMGVFFEILWENADDKLKDKVLNILKNNINKNKA